MEELTQDKKISQSNDRFIYFFEIANPIYSLDIVHISGYLNDLENQAHNVVIEILDFFFFFMFNKILKIKLLN